ncbi:prostate stem cell antigen-like [Triplophysa rosa]|uniref:Glycosylphosphatidylinositol-anchored high density lipoprotein-binding protein 1-like n=1 Tax=Triplophysa rosa TaxID=992332 RepID=A0A9W7WQ99_TRIRA|nr:prostate stem cell antigen-like [Triplophysa rosa]KAI7806387.1 putative glycosylphosphatidylinositol-anchored high density lipoprotein-binding protein 1-like [Triplophysa rosa]
MKSLFSLLLILLTIHSVNTLKCYICSSKTTNDECNLNSEECQAPFDACMTTVAKLGAVKGIVKTCSNSKVCTGAASVASMDNNGNGVQISCCTSRLCNTSGAASIKAQRWLMLLPLILLSLLIRQHT